MVPVITLLLIIIIIIGNYWHHAYITQRGVFLSSYICISSCFVFPYWLTNAVM